jgi:CRP-like cAMP-binding protein
MTLTGDGQSVENVAIGYEGASIFLPSANMRITTQHAGEALRMSRPAYLRHMGNQEFREVMMHYHGQLLAAACQSALCQAFHTAEERLAHWLLVMHDRARSDELPLTQDFLATMLGVQRPTVTIAARLLQAAELIHYRYGRVTIRDHEGLREVACECYGQSALAPPRSTPNA